MKVKRIIPCICIDHAPDYGDSGTYGRPALQTYGGTSGYCFIPYCPNCGRGGISSFNSAYLALKNWNEMQTSLWRCECEGIIEGQIIHTEQWRREFWEDLKAQHHS